VTVRAREEGGQWGGTPSAAADLLIAACRAGVEWVDVEMGMPAAEATRVVRAARLSGTRIIVSRHWPRLPPPAPAELLAACAAARAFAGGPDCVKLVVRAATPLDAETLRATCLPALCAPPAKAERAGCSESGPAREAPAILLAMGERGKLSRVLNSHLTPCTHPILPAAAAPGQLAVAELRGLQRSLGLLPARRYHLFGSPIAASPSPLLHNTGFAALCLPHE